MILSYIVVFKTPNRLLKMHKPDQITQKRTKQMVSDKILPIQQLIFLFLFFFFFFYKKGKEG